MTIGSSNQQHEEARPAGPIPRARRLRSFVRMGRIIRFENFLGTLVAASGLERTDVWSVRSLAVLVLSMLAYMAWVAVAGTFDDIRGFLDGSDELNYRRSEAAGLRSINRKPLLGGWVTVAEARILGYGSVVAGLVLTAAAHAVADVDGRWPLWAYLAAMALATQYSHGLRVSYRGLQETTLFVVKVASVLFPAYLVSGRIPAAVVADALLFAGWFVQVSIFSNAHDVDGDRSARRWTWAALLPERAHIVVIHLWAVSTWAVAAVAVAVGALQPVQVVVLLPVAALHVHQLGLARRRSYLRGRLVGFNALRLGVVLVTLTNLGVAWT